MKYDVIDLVMQHPKDIQYVIVLSFTVQLSVQETVPSLDSSASVNLLERHRERGKEKQAFS